MDVLRVKRKCLEILERVERDGAYLNLLLQEEAKKPSIAPDEYPLLVQLTRGTLEQTGTIDATLAPFLSQGISSLPTQVRNVLRLGTYQIRFLERSKKRDVVFEAVELVKHGKFQGLSKLVNAVLRKVEPGLSQPSEGAEQNFPEWLISRWRTQFGEEETAAFCESCSKPLPLYLRVNSSRISSNGLLEVLAHDGVYAEPSPFSPSSLRVTELPKSVRLQKLKSSQAGLFFVQDLSSTIVSDIVSSAEPQVVYDLCAAPGGKSCSIALSLISSKGRVIATDRTEDRVSLIRDAVHRLGLTNVTSSVRDALSEEGPSPDGADAVLLDAPCSGFGTVGRKVDVRWSKSEETIAELLALQHLLIRKAASLVKPGGWLVYSTCTIDREENEGIIGSFLQEAPDFSIHDLREQLPQTLCTSEGFYRAWPHRHAMAGAFAAVLARRS